MRQDQRSCLRSRDNKLYDLLVTRPEPDSEATVGRLRALGLSAASAPLFAMAPLAFTLPEGQFDGVVVTSANALRALGDQGQPLRVLPLYAVGSRTAEVARAAGFSIVQHAEGGAAALARLIAPLKLKSILYLAGRDRTADLAALVAPVAVTLVEVYDMAQATPALPEARGVMLYSRRAAERFLDLTTPATRAKMAALCLSPNIADVLQNAHFRAIHVAEAPNEPAMMGLAMRVCRDQKGS